MKIVENNFLLRFAVAVILLAHSVPGMFNNGINDFGKYYLNEVGFAPYGVAAAWTIKLLHVAAAICLLLNKYIKLASLVMIVILLTGIFMVHLKEGWFVVGGGRNGVEFNFLLIFVLLTIMFSKESQGKKILISFKSTSETMKLNLDTIILYVQDVEKLKFFYVDILGLEIIEEHKPEWLLLKAGNGNIGLHEIGDQYSDGSKEPFKFDNNTKIVFEITEDIHKLREHLLSKNVLMKAVKTFDNYDFLLCDGEDPEGNVFQLKQKK